MLKRTEDALGSQLRKLARAYYGMSYYQPVVRPDRTGAPFTCRDIYLVNKALSRKAEEHGAWQPEYLAKVLARSEGEVHGWLLSMARTRRSLTKRVHEHMCLLDLVKLAKRGLRERYSENYLNDCWARS